MTPDEKEREHLKQLLQPLWRTDCDNWRIAGFDEHLDLLCDVAKAARAEGYAAAGEEPMFASDAEKDVDYWRLKAREHWEAFQGCHETVRELQSRHAALTAAKRETQEALAEQEAYTAKIADRLAVVSAQLSGMTSAVVNYKRAFELWERTPKDGPFKDGGFGAHVDELRRELFAALSASPSPSPSPSAENGSVNWKERYEGLRKVSVALMDRIDSVMGSEFDGEAVLVESDQVLLDFNLALARDPESSGGG